MQTRRRKDGAAALYLLLNLRLPLRLRLLLPSASAALLSSGSPPRRHARHRLPHFIDRHFHAFLRQVSHYTLDVDMDV